MKIRTLRLKNLNSLQGEWKIDFTLPPFRDNGLFAITGPTGAGKSSLIDEFVRRFITDFPERSIAVISVHSNSKPSGRRYTVPWCTSLRSGRCRLSGA